MFSLRMLFSDHSDFLEVRASDGRLVRMLPTFHKCIIITPFIYRVLSSTQSTFLYILHDLIKKIQQDSSKSLILRFPPV